MNTPIALGDNVKHKSDAGPVMTVIRLMPEIDSVEVEYWSDVLGKFCIARFATMFVFVVHSVIDTEEKYRCKHLHLGDLIKTTTIEYRICHNCKKRIGPLGAAMDANGRSIE